MGWEGGGGGDTASRIASNSNVVWRARTCTTRCGSGGMNSVNNTNKIQTRPVIVETTLNTKSKVQEPVKNINS